MARLVAKAEPQGLGIDIDCVGKKYRRTEGSDAV